VSGFRPRAFGTVVAMTSEHVPAPSEHSPRKTTHQTKGAFVVSEVDGEGAWVRCDVAGVVEVER